MEIIVVDNGRNHEVREYVLSLRTKSKQRYVYVPNDNEGYPGGNVRGVQHATGDCVLIINPHTVLERDAIKFVTELGKFITPSPEPQNY
jgi:GT2 family glycosyltransferase